jgi:hypothetical protein
MKLRIHNPTNEITKKNRDYNVFWDDLTIELKKNNEVYENRFFEQAHFDRFNVNFKSLSKQDGLLMLECEYLIENIETGDFLIFSVADDLTHCILDERSNPKLKKVFVSQFIDYKIKHHVDDYFEKYSPWIYFPSFDVDLEQFYQKRKEKNSFVDKLFFRGATAHRPIINHFDRNILEGLNPINTNDYFNELINYSIGLSIAGVGELCYRDVEYMALGIPFIRFEFQSQLIEPLIPGHHYISIPYDNSIPKHNEVFTDRLGEFNHAKIIESKFKEIINDKEYLKFVGENARKYYEKNLSKKSRLENSIKLINEIL